MPIYKMREKETIVKAKDYKRDHLHSFEGVTITYYLLTLVL